MSLKVVMQHISCFISQYNSHKSTFIYYQGIDIQNTISTFHKNIPYKSSLSGAQNIYTNCKSTITSGTFHICRLMSSIYATRNVNTPPVKANLQIHPCFGTLTAVHRANQRNINLQS